MISGGRAGTVNEKKDRYSDTDGQSKCESGNSSDQTMRLMKISKA